MRRGLLLLAAAAVAAGVVTPQATAASLVPLERALYNDGPTGRFLLDGTWLLRRDPSDVGVRQHPIFQRDGANQVDAPRRRQEVRRL